MRRSKLRFTKWKGYVSAPGHERTDRKAKTYSSKPSRFVPTSDRPAGGGGAEEAGGRGGDGLLLSYSLPRPPRQILRKL